MRGYELPLVQADRHRILRGKAVVARKDIEELKEFVAIPERETIEGATLVLGAEDTLRTASAEVLER